MANTRDEFSHQINYPLLAMREVFASVFIVAIQLATPHAAGHDVVVRRFL
jgi:hypothetical protein